MHTIFMLAVLALILVFTGRGNDFDRGYAAASEGRHEASIDYYTKALRESELSRENRARALNNRGVAYMLMGQRERALVDLDAAVMVEPEDTVIARNRMAVSAAARQAALPGLSATLQPQERIRIFGVL